VIFLVTRNDQTALCSARASDMACAYFDCNTARPASDEEIREAKRRGETLVRAGFWRLTADERRWARL
jgi:hypothetical protein